MRKISLAEFQELTGISTETVGMLLVTSSLPCSIDASGAVSVDLDELSIQRLIEAISKMKRQVLSESNLLFEAEVRSVIQKEFESIVREALGRYLQVNRGE